ISSHSAERQKRPRLPTSSGKVLPKYARLPIDEEKISGIFISYQNNNKTLPTLRPGQTAPTTAPGALLEKTIPVAHQDISNGVCKLTKSN
ncbi:MAG: hypothetical protein P8X63_10825, partial [Desulfuromonadaceae bacterium]